MPLILLCGASSSRRNIIADKLFDYFHSLSLEKSHGRCLKAIRIDENDIIASHNLSNIRVCEGN